MAIVVKHEPVITIVKSNVGPAGPAGPGSGDALVANPLSQFAATTSAQLAGVISDETGTSLAVFNTSPTLVTPLLGTPTSGDLSNCTAYEGTAVSSTGESAGTKFLREDGDGTCSWQIMVSGGDALVANPLSQFAATTSAQFAGVISDETGTGLVVLNNAPTFIAPLLGTPTSGVATNLTGTADNLTAGNVTTNANLTGHVTSTGNAASLGSFTLEQLNTAISDDNVANGTDNSTDVTLSGKDYLTIVGQALTIGSVDVATDITGIVPIANLATGAPDGSKFVRDDGTLVTPAGGAFSDAGDPVVLNTTTKDVVVGAAAINSAKLSVDGDADQVQFAVQSHSTQNANIFDIEDSASNSLFQIDSAGDVSIGSTDSNGRFFVANDAWPVMALERETGSTSGSFDTRTGLGSALRLETRSTGDMGDGFGGGIVLTAEDDASSKIESGRLYARRDGSDTEYAFQIWGATLLLHLGADGEIYLGHLAHDTPVNSVLHATGGSGTNIAGGDLTLATGVSTGNATPSSVKIQSTVAGGSGATPQTLSDTVIVNSGAMSVDGEMLVDGSMSVTGSSFPVARITRERSATTGTFSAFSLSLKHDSGTPAAGFAPGLIFQAMDQNDVVSHCGAIYGSLESWSGSPNVGTGGLRFAVFNNSATPTFPVEIRSTGDVLIGGVVPTGTTGKTLMFGDNTGDPTPAANTAGIFAKDDAGTMRMYAIDETGTSTVMSPHDENGDWIFLSENKRTNKKVKIDVERFFREQFPEYVTS